MKIFKYDIKDEKCVSIVAGNDIKDSETYVLERHGEWEYRPLKGQFCSECDFPSVWKFRYCPNCGAAMRNGK